MTTTETISNSHSAANERMDPFSIWSSAVEADQRGKLEDSRLLFKTAAQSFFDSAADLSKISRACFEYSTLMDAFSIVQEARTIVNEMEFDRALELFSKGSEILRSTIHFGFLSPYIAACASLEVSDFLQETDEDRFQAYKSSIALFEQAKLVLSFMDEYHPLNTLIDAQIRYALSKTLHVESLRAFKDGTPKELLEDKMKRSKRLRKEYVFLIAKNGGMVDNLQYLIANDPARALKGAFIVCYPDSESLWLLNVGVNGALLSQVGHLAFESKCILPKSNLAIPLVQLQKMQIRVNYKDQKSGIAFDEGCISLV